MSEWKTYMLGDICTLVAGFAFKSKDFGNYPDKVIKIADIQPPIVDMSSLTGIDISQYNSQKLEKYKTQKGDYVLAMTGATIGKLGRIVSKKNAYINQRVLLFKPIDKYIDKNYLYYYLCQNTFFSHIRNHIDSETAQPNISANSIGEFTLTLPSLDEQRRIAAILGALDDKIELNRRINANLEEQAQALFKSWFVDFEPFRDSPFVDSELGKIPKGWKVNSIEDLASYIASGGTPRSLDSSYYDGDIRWFTTKELKDEFLFDSEKHISQTALKNSAAKLFPENTVLMAIYASPTVGRLGILTAESTCNQAAVGIIAKEEIGYTYLYLLLLSERINLNNLASGAAQQNLNVGIVKRYRVLVPTIDILGTFNEIINPIFATIRNNTAQIYNLSALRDTLLPKLMSSELSVENDYEL